MWHANTDVRRVTSLVLVVFALIFITIVQRISYLQLAREADTVRRAAAVQVRECEQVTAQLLERQSVERGGRPGAIADGLARPDPERVIFVRDRASGVLPAAAAPAGGLWPAVRGLLRGSFGISG